jgi:hypothetical protein
VDMDESYGGRIRTVDPRDQGDLSTDFTKLE